MSAKSEADPQLGRTLGGQYRIEALLGAGGMGRVYRGRQLSVNRAVAIKVIAGQAPHPPEWVWRFRREAEATASLSHPNSVRLFDFGVTEAEELFMVMELLEGIDLARQLQAHGPLPLVTAMSIARQVLLALCEAHALGITHRDIKPDNIFLASVRGADVVAKVMDFGIAGIAQAQRKSRLTGAGMIIGTPMYMSPEQAQGLRVDGKSDMYSLGIVLFEMLTGRPVFESHTAVTLLLAHVARAPMRLDEAGVQLRQHSTVQALLDRLLAKDPTERPSAAEALETVTGLAARLGIAGATGSMRAIGPSHPSPSAAAAQSARPAGTPGKARGGGDASAEAARASARIAAPAPIEAAAHSTPGQSATPAEALGVGVDGAQGAGLVDRGPAARSGSQLLAAAGGAEAVEADGSLAGAPTAAIDDVALAHSFRSARSTGAPTGSRLRPGLALLGAGLVLGAASALALRWVPTLIEAAQPIAAVATQLATPTPAEPRTVLINSQPSGAHVLLDGEKIGTTPLQLEVHGDTKISVARDGYLRQLVNVPYDTQAPLLVKLAAQPTDKPRAREDKPSLLSLKQEALPRIGPRSDDEHERRDPGPAQPVRESQAPASNESAAATDNPAARAPAARVDAATDARAVAIESVDAPAGALYAREVIERVEPEPGVVRRRAPSDAARGVPDPHQADDVQRGGLDVSRVLEMGRERDGDGPATTSSARERAAALANEHGPTRSRRESAADSSRYERERRELPPPAAETSRSAATSIEAIREDELSEIALDDDERAHVAQTYGLRALGRAVVRAVGKLLIPYPNRERRAALAQMPLAYPSFRRARAAYKQREVDATGFQEAVWQLRERRRQKIWVERDRFARGELSQNQYQAKVDRIWEDFWGSR